MKKDYRKEIKKAFNGIKPYEDGGLFNSGLVLFCQNPTSENEAGRFFDDWIGKAEIRECIDSYLKNKKPDYSDILFPTCGCEEVIRRAKRYVDDCLENDRKEKELSKKIGYPVESNYGSYLIRFSADEIDRSVEGFRERAEKYVKELNLPVEIEEIHLASYFPPMFDNDFDDKRERDSFIKKTKKEIKEDMIEYEKGLEKGIMSIELDSPYRMIKYAGINVEFKKLKD